MHKSGTELQVCVHVSHAWCMYFDYALFVMLFDFGPSKERGLSLGVAAGMQCPIFIGDYFSFFRLPGHILFSQQGLS